MLLAVQFPSSSGDTTENAPGNPGGPETWMVTAWLESKGVTVPEIDKASPG